MADKNDGQKTPTVDDIMKILNSIGERLDRMATEREADNAAARKRQAAIDRQIEATDKQIQATDKQLQATDKQLQLTSAELRTTGEYVREIGKQIGDVGNQWGSIAEYLVAGDFACILKDRFDITIDHSAPQSQG